MPFGGLLAGTVIGLGKSALIDAPAASRRRKEASERTKWAPWTGYHAGALEEADPIGSAMNFGLAGATAGKEFFGKAAPGIITPPTGELVNNSPAALGSDFKGLVGPYAAGKGYEVSAAPLLGGGLTAPSPDDELASLFSKNPQLVGGLGSFGQRKFMG